MPSAHLVMITPKYMDILKLAVSQCYQKEATDKVVQHVINAGHLSVLEHCMATFRVTCSISTLLQLTRHRHLSFTVQSSRGSELKTIHMTDIGQINALADSAMEIYQEIQKKYPHEDAAYLLPKAAEYNLIVSGNLRAWFEYLPKRLCTRAQAEHRELAMQILDSLKKHAPEIFGDRSFMNCEHCTETNCQFLGR